jgi:hypothetical protein
VHKTLSVSPAMETGLPIMCGRWRDCQLHELNSDHFFRKNVHKIIPANMTANKPTPNMMDGDYDLINQ